MLFFKAAPEGNTLHIILKGNKDKTVLKKKKNHNVTELIHAEGQRSRVITPGSLNRFTYTDCSTTQDNTISSNKISLRSHNGPTRGTRRHTKCYTK